MFAMLLAAVTASAEPAPPHGAVFRPSAVTASALVTVRILESATIDYVSATPAGALQKKRVTSLLVDGQHVTATLIEFP